MTTAEDRLIEALAAKAGAVREDTLRPLVVPGRRPRRWPRVVAPVAAAVAVLIVVGVELTVGQMTGTPTASGWVATATAPTVGVGGFPTGVALDAASGTIYVAAGTSDDLAMVNAATCNASRTRGCAQVSHAPTGGGDPIGVAVDEQTRTVYVVNAGSNTVAVINAATCNAVTKSGCSKKPALVSVPGGPEFLAVDPQTDTIYVADTGSGRVSVINGNTCNASDTHGCGQAVATVNVGAGAFPITVDPATSTVYVGTNKDLVLIDGRTCNGTDVRGCGKVLASVPVGGDPAGIAIDQAGGTVYVSSETSGAVTVVSRNACSTLGTAGCGRPQSTVATGADPRGEAAGPAHTVYVTNAGSDTVSMINAAECGANSASGCAKPPAAFPVGASPRRIAADAAVHTVYVVNVAAGTLSLINSDTCNAVVTRGCPTKAPARPITGRGRFGRLGGSMVSNCAPTVVAAASGQPAGPLTRASVHLVSGSVGGQAWSLWARRGVGKQLGLEDGGLVFGGRWYGLCPGYPNVAEMELLNAGARGIDYGFVQHPGKITLGLSSTGSLPPPSAIAVDGMTFFIGQLPRSACSYHVMMLNAKGGSAFGAMHHLEFGACAPGKLVNITESNGQWGGGSISPPSVPAGHGGGSVLHVQDQCSAAATSGSSGKPARPLTRSSVRVASGSIAGQVWSLWAAKGSSGVSGVENGGLVFGGRWYGLCPGAPNPAEFELLNAGARGLTYGYVGNPGHYGITFTPGKEVSALQVRRVMGGTFFIGQLARSACVYSSLTLYARTRSVTDMHQLDFGGCRANHLATIQGGQGSW
jgi:YVTN family beta-propeller protein